MSSPARDDASLLDIAIAARRIAAFVEDVTSDEFFINVEKQSAVLYQIAVVGEATKRLSAAFRRNHPEIPWQRMAGMRDRVTHGYDAIDLELVWSVATEEVNDLLVQIEPLLPDPKQG